MTKLTSGDKARDFVFITPWEKNRHFFAETSGKKSIIFFLRYYGCTTCQLEIHNLVHNHVQFTDADALVYVVLQSDPSTITETVKQEDLPFVLILDAEQVLYKIYDIGSRVDGAEYTDTHKEKKQRAIALGFSHGKYEGNEQQLPAVFIIAPDHTVSYAYYGQEVSDIPDHDFLIKQIKVLS